MFKSSKREEFKKRANVQAHFWDEVGAVEHISLPKLKDAIRKEFDNDDPRFVNAQIEMMKTEARIRIAGNVKVWIRHPNDSGDNSS